MSKLSTQDIRNALIQHYTKDAELLEPIAKQMDAELVRTWSQVMSKTQIDQMLEHTRRSPFNIVQQYFFSKGDKWLREQYNAVKNECVL
jgi:hypothetical protein